MSDCWVCLAKIDEKRVRHWICPECGKKAHLHCLIEYITTYDFNRLFCPSCNRIFSDTELLEMLPKKHYKAYINKVMSAEFDYFTTNNLNRVYEMAHYDKLFKEACEKDWKSYHLIRDMAVACAEHDYDIDDPELVEPLKILHSKGFQITNISQFISHSNISYKVYRQVFADDPIFKPFANMSNFVIEHVLLGTSYINSVCRLPKEVTKPSILMPCEKCDGLVVVYHKRCYCSNCQTDYCSKCGKEKLEDHECDENDVADFAVIKSATKPCPKCGVRIQRSEGCSQMFCVNCHTGFDWNTGELITHNFHNPHRMEWLQSLKERPSEDVYAVDLCHIDVLIDEISRRAYIHVAAWGQMLGAIRQAVTDFNDGELRHEEDLFIKLHRNESIKGMLKALAGAYYISKRMNDTINDFIETSLALYIDYKEGCDKIALEMLTSIMSELYNYRVHLSYFAVEKYIHTKVWLQYVCRWYVTIPDKTGLEVSDVFSHFHAVSMDADNLREDMLR